MQKKQRQFSARKGVMKGLAALFLISLILIIGWGVSTLISNFQDNQDKKDFMTLKSKVEELASQLEKMSDNSKRWTGDENCSRPSVKYDTSKDAYCIINYSVEQRIESTSKGESISDEYNEIVKSSNLVKSFEKNEEYSSDSYRIYDFKIKNTPTKIRCYIAHNIESDINMRSSLDCSGDARDAWYGIE